MKTYIGLKTKALRERFKGDRRRRVRVAAGLPFNLRVGSRILFSEAPFLLAGEAFGVGYPGDESLVAGYSEIAWAGLKTFRIYVRDRATGGESLLLFVMGENAPEELYLFVNQTEIPLHHAGLAEVPDDGDEINAADFWIGESAGIIGMPLFHTPDDLTYRRLWDTDSDKRITPLAFQEQIHTDAHGEDCATVQHLGEMLYARAVEGTGGQLDEYLLPSVEKHDAGFCVRIRVGMALSLADLSFPDTL